LDAYKEGTVYIEELKEGVMDTKNKLNRGNRDIEEGHNIESKAFTVAPTPAANRKKYAKLSLLKTIFSGCVLLLFVVALFYFLSGYAKENFVSKDDIAIIEYQLGQINEKLEQETQVNQLLEKTNILQDKINIQRNKEFENLFADKIDQLTLKIATIEDKINALSENMPVLTQHRYHEVRRGESLFGIAQKYGLTLQKLCTLNSVDPEGKIFPGQKLVVHQPFL
jgi:hypothetical protein